MYSTGLFHDLQETWENRVWKSLTTMSCELKVPLACGRLMSEQETLEENWTELSQWEVGKKHKAAYVWLAGCILLFLLHSKKDY